LAKRVTTRDVAERAGVSRTTVSFVLNNVPGMRISEETRQRVLDAARQLKYYPDATARRMVAGQTKLIGFVLRQSPEQVFGDHFLPQVLNGVSQAVSQYGYHILFLPIPPDAPAEDYMRLVHERHVDGIIISGPRSDDRELVSAFSEGAKVVLIGKLAETDLPSVDVDNIGGARMAAEHLIGLGHRQIGMITNAPTVYTGSSDRLNGFRDALEKHGIPVDTNLIRYGNFTIESGYEAMKNLLDSGAAFTAVFIASDTVALGAVRFLRERSIRLPEDLAVCGFDDIPLADFIDPPLTTVKLPAYGLGWGAGDLMVRLLNEEIPDQPEIILESTLVVRRSCGASVNNSSLIDIT
jgi:DNA-binding LacI/PurR family transcriptional regulator